jgi:hypothetical protein
MRHAVALVLTLALGVPAAATGQEWDQGETRPPRPLFSSDDLLTITFRGAFRELDRDKNRENEERPAEMIVHGDGDAADTFAVDIRARGKFRRSHCRFPPIRLDFKTGDMEGTLFEGMNRVKLVTHCDPRRDVYEEYVLQEYLIYRAFNLVSDLSFRARLARVTYVDTGEDDREVTKYAFMIEPKEELAERNGWDVVEAPVIPPGAVEPEMTALVEMFMYFIANTDWDPFMSAPDEDFCCHNIQPIGRGYGPVFPVPYDFDFSGVINTRYAVPDQSLDIRSVRDRLYRGLCRPIEALQPVFDRFNELRPEIEALYRSQEGLEERTVERTLDFYERFYETINDPRRADRAFVRQCRGV